MAILIKNPEVERKARELARLQGRTITAALDGALDDALSQQPAAGRRTVGSIVAATHRFRAKVGLDRRPVDASRALFDEINEIPGLSDGE